MSARTANAFFASAALHAVLAALIVWFAWAAGKSSNSPPPIFELVAGEGDNFAATEAPALGVPGGIKLDLPAPPAPSPVVAAPSPVVAAPPPVSPPAAQPAVEEYTPVNLAKMVDRIADKRAANIERKLRQEQKAAEAREAREAAAREAAAKAAAAREAAAKAAASSNSNTRTMTKAEFDRLNQGRASPAQRPPSGGGAATSVRRIDTEGIAGGVTGGSTANKTGGGGGTALTRQDIELSDAYIALLIQRLKEAHQKPDGLSDLLQATVKFRLTSNGSVVNVAILSSSRNAEFDQSVLAAFRRISLPPPPPNLRTNDYTITFKMKEDV